MHNFQNSTFGLFMIKYKNKGECKIFRKYNKDGSFYLSLLNRLRKGVQFILVIKYACGVKSKYYAGSKSTQKIQFGYSFSW